MIDAVKHEPDVRKTLAWCKSKQDEAFTAGDIKSFVHWGGWIGALKWILDEE